MESFDPPAFATDFKSTSTLFLRTWDLRSSCCLGGARRFLSLRIGFGTRGRMTPRWPIAVIAIATLLGRSASPHRKYELEPAAQFVFERNHPPTPCEQSQTPQSGPRLITRVLNPPAYKLQRMDRMAFSRAELPVFTMHLESSRFEAYGDTSGNYSLQLCAEAGAASESDAKTLLEEIKLTRNDKMLLLSTPKYV